MLWDFLKVGAQGYVAVSIATYGIELNVLHDPAVGVPLKVAAWSCLTVVFLAGLTLFGFATIVARDRMIALGVSRGDRAFWAVLMLTGVLIVSVWVGNVDVALGLALGLASSSRLGL